MEALVQEFDKVAKRQVRSRRASCLVERRPLEANLSSKHASSNFGTKTCPSTRCFSNSGTKLPSFEFLSFLLDEQKTTATDTLATLDQLIANLRETQTRLSSGDTDSLQALSSKVATLSAQSQAQHKELASSLSKFGKSVEKRFKPMVSPSASPFEGKRDILDKVITEHLVREGRFTSARAFEAEGGAKVEGGEAFTEMYSVLAALRGIPEAEVAGDHYAMDTDAPITRLKPNLEPAINWAKRNATELYASSSHLEFELHRTRFVQLRDDGASRQDLVNYVRKEMASWVGRGFEKGKQTFGQRHGVG